MLLCPKENVSANADADANADATKLQLKKPTFLSKN